MNPLYFLIGVFIGATIFSLAGCAPEPTGYMSAIVEYEVVK